ncbi:polyadenylate-binding protein-interacting protein 12-like [Senna tora]|uniref:Polyadenylate-binding protein-interacting protein 12-like n=1 Tax=Senna tora TaxID=362788 RepID=A0A834TGX9_9FABA|nr:polyadenylate-binding protein-interacting protein 12-like [Senna tora]
MCGILSNAANGYGLSSELLNEALTVLQVADSAMAALNCNGVILGTLPIRVSRSKTPVRSHAPQTSML